MLESTEEATGFWSRIDLPWIDAVGLSVIALFFLLGVWRGLWWQVIRLAGVVASVALARGLTPRFTPTVEETFELSSGVSHGLVWFVLFLSGLVVSSLLGLIGKRALEAMQLGLVDRAGGALAGALTGVILHSALLVVLTGFATTDFSSRTLDGSRSAVLLDRVARKTPLLLDAQAAERIVGPWAEAWEANEAEAAE